METVNTLTGQVVTLMCHLTFYANVSTRFWEFSAHDPTELTRIVTQWPRDNYYTKYADSPNVDANVQWDVSTNFNLVLNNVTMSAEGWYQCGMSAVNEEILDDIIFLHIDGKYSFKEPHIILRFRERMLSKGVLSRTSFHM